jgi:hypothetical protein
MSGPHSVDSGYSAPTVGRSLASRLGLVAAGAVLLLGMTGCAIYAEPFGPYYRAYPTAVSVSEPAPVVYTRVVRPHTYVVPGTVVYAPVVVHGGPRFVRTGPVRHHIKPKKGVTFRQVHPRYVY